MVEAVMRRPLQGVVGIVRFNAPFFVAAAVVVVVGVVGAALSVDAFWLRVVSAAAALGALSLSGSALLASYLTYDRSRLYSWSWFDRFVASSSSSSRPTIAHVHTGLDESTAVLSQRYPTARVLVFDASDVVAQTEASIARARALVPLHPSTVATGLGPLPVHDVDVIVLPMAAHEVRDDDVRARWFATLAQSLRRGGQIVVVEHLRDGRNLLAFHLGVLHFLSRRTWRTTFEQAGLVVVEETWVTPLLALFALQRAADRAGNTRDDSDTRDDDDERGVPGLIDGAAKEA
jgi:SAM-dependent methyltransferase